jgi:glycosyltransferase involved in cell wall biosynthesis
MKIRFEEPGAAQRAGGIETAIRGLVESLREEGISVSRSSERPVAVHEDIPECVHFHGIWSPSLASRFLRWRRRGIPCVVSPHGMLEPWALAHKPVKKMFAWHIYQRHILNRAAALHATSAREAANLRRLGLKATVETIPWGIEIAEPRDYAAAAKARSAQRTALFVGRLHPVKGLPMLVEAWAKVRPSEWKMKIVGPDEDGHRAKLESLVRKADLNAVFEFTGGLEGDALREAYEDSDLFILPSYTENFGMVVGEALSYGVPVIASQGAPWEILATEGGGWWVPASVEGLSMALASATACSKDELDSIGGAGRRLVVDKYSWRSVATRFAGLYRMGRRE